MVGTRSSSQALGPGSKKAGGTSTSTSSSSAAAAPSRKRGAAAGRRWSHAPTRTTLAWLAVSLPLVAWDTGYVLGRPATMPGGWAHAPLWTPYELYGRVDHVYGFKQWDLGNGFTAAQGWLNAVETAMYLSYLWLWWRRGGGGGGEGEGKGGEGSRQRRRVAGRDGALAVLVGFSAAVMTLSKTVLYWLNEAGSGFDNIGHNELFDLITLWIIPKCVSPYSHPRLGGLPVAQGEGQRKLTREYTSITVAPGWFFRLL